MFREEFISSRLCWVLENDAVQMAITHAGAHLAPVNYLRNTPRTVQPYYISPWHAEPHHFPRDASEAVLRGDFFCLPFGCNPGGNAHGRCAGTQWRLIGASSEPGSQSIQIEMENALHAAVVTRTFHLREGENAVYGVTRIAGLEGCYPFGHHVVLRCPAGGQLLISTSDPLYGVTFPGEFADGPARQTLARGAEFENLRSVPSSQARGDMVDCSVYPRDSGCSDFLQIAARAEPAQPAWTVAVNGAEQYLWFSFRNPGLLPCTLLWMENGGRQAPPWSGRTCLLGVEDVCSYFNFGTPDSVAPNSFSRQGIKTFHNFEQLGELSVPYVQGAATIPLGFGRVQKVHFAESEVCFVDENGVTVRAAVQTHFVFSGRFSSSASELAQTSMSK